MDLRERRPANTASPTSPGHGSGGQVHLALQNRLRSISQEGDDLFAASIVDDVLASLSPKHFPPDAAKSVVVDHATQQQPQQSHQEPDATEGKLTLKGKAMRQARRAHDALEAWGYRNFPVITDHFNLLVYAIDLGVQSVKWFQFGLVACCLGLRLFLYAIMLLPAFVRVMLTYYHDPRIHRRIRYGPAEREYLDIYVPKEALAAQKGGEGAKVPVVIAVMGGAFMIGHRGYNAQLGLRLMDFGIITVGIDYRNFPRGTMPDMVEDVSRGVRWVFQNIDVYGGDTSNMMLIGQSAGAHLTAMLLLEHCLLEIAHSAGGPGSAARAHLDAWSVKSFKAYLGVSGPYDLIKLGPHLASRGLYPRIMDHMSNGDLAGCSPERVLDSDEWKEHGAAAAELLPPICLFHGYKDKAVPVWSSSDFAQKLEDAGVKHVKLDLRRDMTHTYPVIEGPLQRHDIQLEVILPVLLGESAGKRLVAAKALPPLWPVRILDIAGHVSPF